MYQNVKEKICTSLEKLFEVDNITIIGRVKNEKSLREKIIRNNYFKKYKGNANYLIEELSDTIGIRINCLLTRDEVKYFDKLKANCDKIDEQKYKHYLKKTYEINGFSIDLDSKQPQIQKNGKEIYRIDATYKDDNIKFNIEIQIKSSINSLWGEIEHKLFYKNYDYLSSQEFYANLMILIYENLDSVEKQLELLKDHIENDSKEIDQARDFLSKLLYKKYKDECVKVAYSSNIDFRSICKLVCELYFTNPVNAFRELKESIDIVNNISEFRFKENSNLELNKLIMSSTSIPNVVNLATSIDKIIKEENVYWNVFINIYSIINKTEDYNKTILHLSNKLNSNCCVVFGNIINIITDDELMDTMPDIFTIIMNGINSFLVENARYEMFLCKNIDKLEKNLLMLFKLNTTLLNKKNDEINKEEIKKYIIFMYKIMILNDIELEELEFLLMKAEISIFEKNCEEKLKDFYEIWKDNKEFNNKAEIIEIIINQKEVKDID
ncbi:hypothetical protein FDB57_03180 [Clostridium botulinum]|nr:hypothetical protein [Clostridium botulinum]